MNTILQVQAALKNAGFDPGKIDGLAGRDTYAAVKAFQAAHELTPGDGSLGWVTLQALFPYYPWSQDLAERATEIAACQVGVREEQGNNAGLMVDVYQRAVEAPVGSSYCMAFVVWCYAEAAHSLDIPFEKTGLVPTASCMDQLRRATCTKILMADYHDPRRGDVGIISFNEIHGHTFFVTGNDVNKPGEIDTVEGNTNDNGSPDGIGDFFRTRPIAQAKAFLRIEV